MKKQNLAVVLLSTLFVSGAALADAEAALTAIGTEAAALATAAWPIVTAIVISFITMKLFKKFANKAT